MRCVLQLKQGLLECMAAQPPPPGQGRHLGADELFPVFVYAVLKANPPKLASTLAYVQRFRSPMALKSEAGCYFTHLQAAVSFLESLAIEREAKGHIKHNHACGEPCKPPDLRQCSFSPADLKTALEANANYGIDSRFKYNEVIIDAEQMKRGLPHTLLAVFYMDEVTRELATSVHQRFLTNYRIGADSVPLLRLSLSEGFAPG